MQQPIQSLQIDSFSGISTLISPTNQKPGTMAVADAVVGVPEGALSFGPYWRTAWGQTALATAIATALSAYGPPAAVNFVTLTRSGYTFLIAWDSVAARPRGIWQVAGTGNPDFTKGSGSSVASQGNLIYLNKTAGLPWYGSWVQDELWLGNGTDLNLVWKDGALDILGPSASSATDPQDPAQYAFPPCTTFLPGNANQVYATGNVTYPLRLWCSEIPSITYPINRGIKTTSYSYRDLQVNATSTTGLSSFGANLIVHLNIGSPMIIEGYNGSAGGWKLSQIPTKANASAINPNCTRDTKLTSFYLGSDLEFYLLPTFRGSIVDRGYDGASFRDGDIVTKKAPGQWNSAATKPLSGTDYFLLEDEKNGRTWAWLNMSAGSRQGVYVFDQRTQSIFGPWRYPDFYCACQVRDENLNGTLMVGITRDGAFIFADVAAINNYTLPTYSTALPAGCAELSSAPTASPGIPYVGVSADGQSFTQVLNGQTLRLATPWSEWEAATITTTKFYNNARVSVLEFNEMDCRSPSLQKEFAALRSTWNRNSPVYVGVYCEVSGYRYGGWRGLYYPSVDWVAGIGGMGSTVRIRVIVVSFNDQNAVLTGATLNYLTGVEN